MKLLIILSCNDFDNFTRRATVEAICKKHPDTTLLFFNGIKGFPIKNPSNPKLRWKTYYSLSLGKGRQALRKTEISLSGLYWKRYIRSFAVVFLGDPNQELILDYVSQKQKIIYLIRDPNALQSTENQERELRILKVARTVFATSKNLTKNYLPDYYGFQHPNIHYWPNTVDLTLWKYITYEKLIKLKKKKVVGMAGNIGKKRTDFELLEYLAENTTDYEIHFAGRISSDSIDNPSLKKFLNSKNVKYLGFIPFEKLPQTLIQWEIGLITDSKGEYASYMHHNKVYQYLAMGLPVVVLRTHNDYDTLGFPLYIANTKEEYNQKIKEALAAAGKPETIEHCLQLAKENSSEVRAKEFLSILKTFQEKE